MNFRAWTLLPLLLFPALAACAEKKDLSPPPLNPHPKEVLHVTVTFDHPEDAKRYIVIMKALYQNQQRECGYFDPLRGGGSFVYPHGTFDVPNESGDPKRARFNVYLDRYNEVACNWELAAPYFLVRDSFTGGTRLGTGVFARTWLPAPNTEPFASSRLMMIRKAATADGRCRTCPITVASPSRFMCPRTRRCCVRACGASSARAISSSP